MSNPLFLVAASCVSLFALAACGGSEPTQDKAPTTDIATITGDGVAIAMACGGCHSPQSEAMVDLTDYGADPMRQALTRYRSERDGTTVMHRLARGYSDADIELLATYFDTGTAAP